MDRVDVIGAMILGVKPHFELELNTIDLDPDLRILEPCNPIGTRYQRKLSNLTGLRDLSQETIEVYCLLRHLITEREKAAGLQGLGITDTEFHSFQLFTFRVMHRLIALTQYEIPDSENRNTLIYGLLGNAGMIHIMMFTWSLIGKLGYAKLISTRIKSSLEMIDIQAFQIAYPEMMLWITRLGGMAS
jgi:hypothetical protein